MKIKMPILVAALFPSAMLAQGTLVYDQQSSTDESPFPYGTGAHIQQLSPYGQSFTPTLSGIDFIRLNLNDNNPNNSAGATLYLNLRSNSISGTILATTAPVTLTNAFTGPVSFFLPTTTSLTPSSSYVFEIVAVSGSDPWNAIAGELNYPGGFVYANGFPAFASDLWFREGMVVPEPASGILLVAGASLLFLARRRRAVANNGSG
jgi:hypothetical protein